MMQIAKEKLEIDEVLEKKSITYLNVITLK